MNKELLLKVKAKILEHPEEFNMAHWHHPCKTAHCIGGYAQLIQRGYCDGLTCEEDAPEDLGLDLEQSENLFHVANWPDVFMISYCDGRIANDSVKCAQVAADRIDHFIATEGME